ncbi:MAG: hypothetical protein ABF382_04910 [Akkermansiaceae bacterium]
MSCWPGASEVSYIEEECTRSLLLYDDPNSFKVGEVRFVNFSKKLLKPGKRDFSWLWAKLKRD